MKLGTKCTQYYRIAICESYMIPNGSTYVYGEEIALSLSASYVHVS